MRKRERKKENKNKRYTVRREMKLEERGISRKESRSIEV